MATAILFPASRLKNHTPGLPSATTYVRTFNSGNAESQGTAGVPRRRTPDIRNGTTPSHACPSYVSISNSAGICRRSVASSTRQCAKSRSCQLWAMIQGPAGSGHGRCATCSRFTLIGNRCRNSTQSFRQYTLLYRWRIEFSAFKSNERYKRSGIMQRKASAVWQGGLKDGKGTISTDSGTLKQTQYSFSTRFENGVGTNPEELLAAAHAGCFTMALSAQLGGAGLTASKLETTATISLEKVGEGFAITKGHLDVVAHVPNADKAKFDAAVKAAETGCPVSRLFKAEIS